MSHPVSREIPIEPAHCALLFVDVQNYNCTWDGGEYAHLGAAEKEQRYGYFFRTLRARRCRTWCGCSSPAAVRASR